MELILSKLATCLRKDMGFLNLHQNQINYDYKTKQYSSGGTTFQTHAEAREKQWQCNKCERSFSTMKQLKIHKSDDHSY